MPLNPIGPGVPNQIAKTLKKQQKTQQDDAFKGDPHFEQAIADQKARDREKAFIDFVFPPEKKK